MATDAGEPELVDRLTVGSPREWEAFKVKHRRFLVAQPRLTKALDAGYGADKLPSMADKVVFGMGRVMGEDFNELVVLAGNGHGLGGLKILRGMFERAVTVRYLHANPEDADRFAQWDYVSHGKLAARLLKDFPDYLKPVDKEFLTARVAEMANVKTDFEVSDCKKCGTNKPGHTWGLDLVSMAERAETLRPLMVSCYMVPLLYVHATAWAVARHVKEVGDASFKFEFVSQPKEATEGVMLAHLLLLDMLNVFKVRFNPAGLGEALVDAEKAFLEVWGVASPPGHAEVQ